MNTIQTEVIEKGLKQARRDELEKLSTNTSKRPKEEFSRREIEELMGTKRDTFKRHRGSIRRK